MSSEIELRRGGHDLADGYLTQWAENARQVAAIAASLARTSFVPASLRAADIDATVGNVTAAILTGAELGLTPMGSLRSIDVIQGTPALRAIALRALVLNAGHEIVVRESNSTRAVVAGRRRGSTDWQTSTWTIDRAKHLAGREQWRAQPTAMLLARATAECARLIAADVLLAIPYIAEEIDDQAEPASEPVEKPETPPRRTAQRRRTVDAPPPIPPTLAASAAAPTSEDNPPLDDTSTEQPAEPDPPMITAAQSKALHAALRAVGAGQRDAGLQLVSEIVGRDVESTKTLYEREASTVIDELRLRRTRLAQADEDAALEAAYEAEMKTAQQQQPALDGDPALEDE
ncbi:MAG TPA: hypothetical protein VH912_24220 [Streptosporangiaceae bacterium]